MAGDWAMTIAVGIGRLDQGVVRSRSQHDLELVEVLHYTRPAICTPEGHCLKRHDGLLVPDHRTSLINNAVPHILDFR